MISDSIEKDSIRSSSPIVYDESSSRKSLFLSCCGCSRKQQRTVDETNGHVRQGFLKRIQFFKAQKRQSTTRKQQLASNSSLPIETEVIPILNNERQTSLPPSDLDGQSYRKYSPPPLRNSQSIPRLHHATDSYSFADIEVASSITEQKYPQENAIPKGLTSRNYSLTTANLSTHSTQSLLRKLLDKAHRLDEYYNDVSNKTVNHPSSSSLSSSSNSLLRQSSGTPRSFLHRYQSNESVKKSSHRKYRQFHPTISSDSSRFDLYADEDNILRELIRFNNDIDLILSRLEMEGESFQQTIPPVSSDLTTQMINDQEEINPTDSHDILTMRTNTNELNLHLLSSHDLDRLRETALFKLLKLNEQTSPSDNQTITLTKLNKLPKATTWKGKRVFGVPLRIYQQTTGNILPISITDALQYVRMHAGKCDGLFRKPGVKSKIDHLRAQIETTDGQTSPPTILFDEYQPFVVADVIRQYFRELPECLMPPALTRLLCDLFKHISQDEQFLAIRYAFLSLSDETREVLEIILRFLLDVSIRSGNSQTSCRSLARIFLPSVFQSYHDVHQSTKMIWWKWKKDKLDIVQQENERLTLEQCLMTMILNVDFLCRVPSAITDELQLPSARKIKRLDELVRNACNGDFHLKRFISKTSEQFLQRLSTLKFKNVPTTVDGVSVSVHRPSSDADQRHLPTWKCSVDISDTNVKQVYQRILHERERWDKQFAESRTVEKIDEEKEIMQYVLNFLDLVPVRSFCEFRFSKKITTRSIPAETNGMLISAVSIDHIQNHFLPGSIGTTHDMHYYITPSSTQSGHTTVTQVACVDYSGRSTQWYEHIYGSLLSHNLRALRETFTNTKIVRV